VGDALGFAPVFLGKFFRFQVPENIHGGSTWVILLQMTEFKDAGELEIFGFQKLDLWKKAREVKIAACLVAKRFPLDEHYMLARQLIRSARSMNALVAEGHGRYSWPDQLHFCIQARGSLAETMNHLIDAYDDQYITLEQLQAFLEKGKELEYIMNGYIRYLRGMKEKSKYDT
jgi:four helix bundle protein